MTEYVEREEAMRIVRNCGTDYATAFSKIRELPAADLVEVVRCKDCKHLLKDLSECGAHLCMQNRFARRNVRLDGFCNYGERKCVEENQKNLEV